MQPFAVTLVAEGSSDQALIPLINAVLDLHCDKPYSTTFATELPKGALRERIAQAIRMYPCDMLFVHRDADRASVAEREKEIQEAAAISAEGITAICMVPVRMTEAWLLVDVQAIRRAAANPSGRIELNIPPIDRLETIPDPKAVLFDVLAQATELSPQRLRRFDRNRARRQISGFMEDYDVLRQLPSFAHFESQVRDYFSQLNP